MYHGGLNAAPGDPMKEMIESIHWQFDPLIA